jgi:hypothetical protein
MRARILMDEPFYGPHMGTKLMKKVMLELRGNGWSKTEIVIVPADDPNETRREIEQAVRKILRDNGKDETFSWA